MAQTETHLTIAADDTDAPATGASADETPTVRSLALAGARDMGPMALGLVPFGVAIGGTIASSSIGLWPALASGPIILAGAAHLATLQMLDAGVAPVVIVVSALLINLRIVLYSATLAPWFAGVPRRRRLGLAATITDQLYLLCIERFPRGDLDVRGRTAYYTGAAGCLVSIWLGAQYTAAVLGAELPAAVHLDMAAPLALTGLLARSAKTGSARVAAAAAIVVVAAGARLPLGSSILIATLGGILAAAVAEGVRGVDR
jgi:predicted branched-subunit amino acid permease